MAVHKVVRVDVRREVFDREGTAIQDIWRDELNTLMDVLKESPSVLRFAYMRQPDESEHEARTRLRILHDWVDGQWQEQGCCYDLVIETELFLGESAGGAK